MEIFIFVYSLYMPILFTILYPPLHRYLQSYRIMALLIMFQILLIILFWNTMSYKYLESENILNLLIVANPILFFILYRIFNYFILKIYKRPIYFRSRFNTDSESHYAKFWDIVFQVILSLLILFPFILLYLNDNYSIDKFLSLLKN